MSSYEFQPLMCFNARCWWQLRGARIAPPAWAAARNHLAPLWVRFESGDGEDGWIRAEPEGAFIPSTSLKSRAQGILCDTFWFGVYKAGKRYAYELRPAYVGDTAGLWPKLEYVMTKDFGYVGMSGSPQAAGSGSAPLWLIEGLDPSGLEAGQLLCNLEPADPSGNALRRYRQFGRPYLATHAGIRGLLSMQIINYPVPPHRNPIE